MTTLAQRAMQLQLHPERELHPSWLPAAWPARHRRIARWNDGGLAVLGEVLRMVDARPAPSVVQAYDFDAPLKRLALMDSAALRQLAALCGFAAHRALLRQRGVAAVLKRQVRRYGEDLPRFLLERVPPLTRFAMNTAVIEAKPTSAGAVIVQRGHRLLLGALAAEGELAVARVQRKLPRRIAQHPPPPLIGAQREQLAELILLCLIPERLPAWDWLF